MKKKLALLLAVVMAFSMVTPAFATGLPTPGDTIVDTHIPNLTINDALLRGTASTAVNLYFVIDPLGLLTLSPTDSIPADPVTDAVAWVGGTAPEISATNQSDVDVLFDVEISVNATGGVNAITDPTASREGGLDVIFWMELNAASDWLAAATHTAHAQVIPFGTAPVSVTYHFPAVPHETLVDSVNVATTPASIVASRQPVDPSASNGTSFSVQGRFNNLADWGAATATVGIQATYTMRVLPEGSVIAATPYVTNVQGLLAADINAIAGVSVAAINLIAAPVANSINLAVPEGGGIQNMQNLAAAANVWASIPLTLPSGVTVSSINLRIGAAGPWPVAANNWGHRDANAAEHPNTLWIRTVNPGIFTVTVTLSNGDYGTFTKTVS